MSLGERTRQAPAGVCQPIVCLSKLTAYCLGAAMSMEEAAAEWGEGTAEDTMASNSRVRAARPRQLGWKPQARGLIEEIEQGCYR